MLRLFVMKKKFLLFFWCNEFGLNYTISAKKHDDDDDDDDDVKYTGRPIKSYKMASFC